MFSWHTDPPAFPTDDPAACRAAGRCNPLAEGIAAFRRALTQVRRALGIALGVAAIGGPFVAFVWLALAVWG